MRSGKVAVNVLKRSVLRPLQTHREEVLRSAGIGSDCALFAPLGADCVATCTQEGVVAIPSPEGEIGTSYIPAFPLSHYIQKVANNLAAAGAEPFTAQIALLLPEELSEPQLRAMLQSAEEACKVLRLSVTGGQTQVTSAVREPITVVTGYGRKQTPLEIGRPHPGQHIVVSKWIALEGTALLARRYRKKLLTHYPPYLVDEATGFDRYYSILPEAATAIKSGGCAMHDASEGGILAALWELCEGAGVGLSIDMKKLPIRQETVEVCEALKVNPYELMSGGSLVIACDDGEALVEALALQGIPATIVGTITEGPERIIHNEDEIRYMDRPAQDAVYAAIQAQDA